MAFDFDSLENPIYKILSAPHTDLTTISAKSVRRQLIKGDPYITPEFMRDNKEEVDIVIGRVFERVNAQQGEESNDVEDRPESRKRKQDEELGEEELGEEEVDDDEIEAAPVPKKAKKASKNELSDAELARQLSNELNGRSRRTSAKPTKARGSTNGAMRKGGRTKKSAETVDSDDDSEDGDERKSKKKSKSSRSSSGGAKGGFAKEFLLSEPLAAVLRVDKLSRPQVVKQLWVYIKDNELQNPGNKREIICDAGFRGIFGVDKIDMFKMNKVLGQHLHELEG
ncbi:Upstream activation factor subunit spp27 [Termitomyces sp. T112]|nr:Upstream activation factor subunit spp27 [Termitomyces sp. T112]